MIRVFALICALSLTACSTISIEKSKTEGVKKIALVGFDLQQQMPPTLVGALLGTNQGNMGGGLQVAECQSTGAASDVMKDLSDTLARDMQWKVVSGTTLARDAKYIPLHTRYTEGAQLRQPTPAGFRCYVDSGILDPFSIEKLGPEGRKALMRDLGVDGIATATIAIHLENKSFLKKLIASGDLASQGIATFRLYVPSSDDAVWVDMNAEGKETTETTEYAVGLTNEKALHEQALKASRSAIQAIIQRYRDAG